MWILWAILARVFWAGNNTVDQVLARAHDQQQTLSALSLQFVCCLPFAVATYFFSRGWSNSPGFIFYCFGAVAGATMGMVPYLMALRREQAHDVVPYLELTPVFLILFAYLFKEQLLPLRQLAGAGLVIVSGFLFSWDFAHARFKIGLFARLAVASLLFATYQFCISQAENYASLLAVMSAYYFGLTVVGALLFVILKDMRRVVVKTLIRTKGKTILLAMGSNSFDLLAFYTLLLAFKYAPTVGHVGALSGVQPIFSFLLAVPLARFFPEHFSRINFDRAALAKLSLILLIAFGVYLLSTT